ncbi:hypothetical protein [Bradyrhizobium sp. OAE829]|uniref:hypothetical protein n=1 Tax=Bradyrhizobium sp. OAE829 TaxID=2663807 RepID=UPI00178A9340
MRYPWPFESPDPVLQASLDIALDYLEATRQAYPYSMTEVVCARIILDEWLTGGRKCRHQIWLANKAIVAIETKQPPPGPVAVRAAGPRYLT